METMLADTLTRTTTPAARPPATEPDGGHAARPRRPIYLNDIRALAYRKWEAAGKPAGDCTRFWMEAEQELLRGA
jgi:hypothetical protein